MAEQSKDSRGACNVHLTVNNGSGVAFDQSRSSILPPTTIESVIVPGAIHLILNNNLINITVIITDNL